MAKSDSMTRWEFPYIRRLCATLRKFIAMSDSDQRLIVSAKEECIWWRGEDVKDFYRVIHEYERIQKIGPDDYRKEAVSRIKKMKVGGSLPYEKEKREP